MKKKEVERKKCIDMCDITVAEAIEILHQFPEHARLIPEGYENYGEFSLRWNELEGDTEFSKRLATYEKRKATIKEKELRQLEKLEKKYR